MVKKWIAAILGFGILVFGDAVQNTTLRSERHAPTGHIRYYMFNVSYVQANPDGMQSRKLIGINGRWPCPDLWVNKGDRIRLRVINSLPDQRTSIHFHGIIQKNTNLMDGTIGSTQCPIPPGGEMMYDFTINQAGTFWYHSHVTGQYGDGLRGSLIVKDREREAKFEPPTHELITVGDWYHNNSPNLLSRYLSYSNPNGDEPVPSSILMNEGSRDKIEFSQGIRKNTIYHLVSYSMFLPVYLWAFRHKFEVIEMDGMPIKPKFVKVLSVAAGQRYAFRLRRIREEDNPEWNNATVYMNNIFLCAALNTKMLGNVTPKREYNSSVLLLGDEFGPIPSPGYVDKVVNFPDAKAVARVKHQRLPPPREYVPNGWNYTNEYKRIELTTAKQHLGSNELYTTLNNIAYKAPFVPVLYQVLTAGHFANYSKNYDYSTNTQIITKPNTIVQVKIHNTDVDDHPFHLHGHHFEVVKNPYKSESESESESEQTTKGKPKAEDGDTTGAQHGRKKPTHFKSKSTKKFYEKKKHFEKSLDGKKGKTPSWKWDEGSIDSSAVTHPHMVIRRDTMGQDGRRDASKTIHPEEDFTSDSDSEPDELDLQPHYHRPRAIRDTIVVKSKRTAIIRFIADNPGVWLFHCHMSWHIASGLAATFIESPDLLREQHKLTHLPRDHLNVCQESNFFTP